MQKIAVLGDIHLPHHDRQALHLARKVLQYYRPDVIVQVGDLLDNPNFSRHGREVKKATRLKRDTGMARYFLNDLRTLAPRIHVTEGNHDAWVDRYLNNEAPDLLDTHPTMRELLGLGVDEWTPYRETLRIGKAVFTHDLGFSGQTATQRHRDAAEANLFFGHLHRLEAMYGGNLIGKKHVAMCVGWLGDPAKATYAPLPVRAQWMHGMVLIDMADDGTVYSFPVPFINGTARVTGRTIR